ncbi:MAG: NAD(P)/FAD-dependent oxidoreductase [Bacteroidia bacterium]|nr:NAD(P)/FAD-dependent oxidoreductase [Bacteroidia bacterium]
MKRITLVGGGLAGSLAAVYLAKRGYEVNIYERRPDMRNVEIPAGRSINLALSTRGIDALKRVGLDQVVLDQAIPMAGRMMHDEKGNLAYQPYGKDGQVINSVSRAHLNIQLLKLADEHKNVNQFFNMRCQEVDIENSICKFTNEKTGENIEVKSDYILGSDGAYSPVRLKMMKNDRFDYSQSYTKSGYKELNITPTPDGNFAMDPDSLHIWPRGNFMMIALPNPDKSFTCTLFMPYAGEVGFDQINSDQEILNFMNTYFADAVPLMPELLDDFKRNPVGSLVTVRCYPWHMKKATLIGDACHAIVPFYGQGMNCAFEDCVELDNCLEEFGDWDKAMNEYQKRRKPNADAIADLALQNFIEMRDLVGDKDFLHYKKMEHQLCELYPDLFKSQYEMVTFSKVPYSEAKTKGAQNTQRVHDLIASNYEDKITDRSFVEEWFA